MCAVVQALPQSLEASASQPDALQLLVWTEPPASEASLVAQMVKNPSVMKENQVRSLGWEDPLEKGMAIHSSISWRIPQTEEPGGLQSRGSQRIRPD